MFERFSRSWELIKASASVLRQDKELLWFPVFSTIAALLVIASFMGPVVVWQMGHPEQELMGEDLSPLWFIWMFCFYLVQYFVMLFFNTALCGAAMIRLNGGDPTLRDGLAIAWSKVGSILGYAAIAATVGLILRAIQEKSEWLGRLVAGLLGAAWTLASFLVVPVLVTRDVGPLEALKESAVLLKKTWGENLIGQGGVGVVFALMYLALWIVCGGLLVVGISTQSGALMMLPILLGIVGTVILALIQAALQGIYAAALYRYATGAPPAAGFDANLLSQAFRAK